MVINYPTAAESAVDEVAKEIGPIAVAACADVAIEEEVTSMIDFVLGEFGQIDILVNNANSKIGARRNIPTSDWNDIFSFVNGTFFCTAVLSHMYERNSGRL